MEKLEQALELLREAEVALENEGKEQEANKLLNIIWRIDKKVNDLIEVDTTGVV